MNRIHAAFAAALAAFATDQGLVAQWPNAASALPAPCLRPWVRPDLPVATELGSAAGARHSGDLVVEVVVPAGEGESRARSIAASLLRTFPRGASLGLGGLALKSGGLDASTDSEGRYARPSVQDGEYALTVRIPYQAYLTEE